MALSNNEKLLRKKTIGECVRMLRLRLGKSQIEFAEMVGGDVDFGSVSRWERGVWAPHPWKRNRLAGIARRHGFEDLAVAFTKPMGDWKLVLAEDNPGLYRLITLLEIAAINTDLNQGESADDEVYYQALHAIAIQIRDRLLDYHMRGGDPVLLDDHQRKLWSEILKDVGLTGRKTRHGRTTR